MANECPKKEVKSNHVRVTEETPDSSEGEYEPDTDSTEELDASGSIRTYKTTVRTSKEPTRPFLALEFTLFINGKPARVLTNTGTIGGTLISNKFVTSTTFPTQQTRTQWPSRWPSRDPDQRATTALRL